MLQNTTVYYDQQDQTQQIEICACLKVERTSVVIYVRRNKQDARPGYGVGLKVRDSLSDGEHCGPLSV